MEHLNLSYKPLFINIKQLLSGTFKGNAFPSEMKTIELCLCRTPAIRYVMGGYVIRKINKKGCGS